MNPIASTTGSPFTGATVTIPPVPEIRPVKAVTDTRYLCPPPSDSNLTKTETSSSAPKVSDDEIKRATEELQRCVNKLAPELEFSVDKDTGQSVITLTDRNTDEVIRQIPSEEALALTRAMDQFQRGLIFNRQV
jgi:flagellar protein FlaG